MKVTVGTRRIFDRNTDCFVVGELPSGGCSLSVHPWRGWSTAQLVMGLDVKWAKWGS